VVDDEGHADVAQAFAVLDDVLGAQVQHGVPAERRDAVEGPVEHMEVRRAAEVADEVEARPPDAAAVQCFELRVGRVGAEDADAAVGAAAGGDGVEHRAVVGAVAARLHDHRALHADRAVDAPELRDRRLRRRVAAVRRVGEAVGRAEDVAVRVAGAGR
jgi:hypothetical protein